MKCQNLTDNLVKTLFSFASLNLISSEDEQINLEMNKFRLWICTPVMYVEDLLFICLGSWTMCLLAKEGQDKMMLAT